MLVTCSPVNRTPEIGTRSDPSHVATRLVNEFTETLAGDEVFLNAGNHSPYLTIVTRFQYCNSAFRKITAGAGFHLARNVNLDDIKIIGTTLHFRKFQFGARSI